MPDSPPPSCSPCACTASLAPRTANSLGPASQPPAHARNPIPTCIMHHAPYTIHQRDEPSSFKQGSRPCPRPNEYSEKRDRNTLAAMLRPSSSTCPSIQGRRIWRQVYGTASASAPVADVSSNVADPPSASQQLPDNCLALLTVRPRVGYTRSRQNTAIFRMKCAPSEPTWVIEYLQYWTGRLNVSFTLYLEYSTEPFKDPFFLKIPVGGKCQAR